MKNLIGLGVLSLGFLLLAGCASSGKDEAKERVDTEPSTITVTGQRISREEFMRRGGDLQPSRQNSQQTAFELLKKALGATHYPDISDYPDCTDLLARLRLQNIPIESIQPNKVTVLSPRQVALNYQYETDQCLR